MVVAGKARRHQLDAQDSTGLDGHFTQCGKSASTMAETLQSSPSMLRIVTSVWMLVPVSGRQRRLSLEVRTQATIDDRHVRDRSHRRDVSYSSLVHSTPYGVRNH
jgi:hypothetical protein